MFVSDVKIALLILYILLLPISFLPQAISTTQYTISYSET